GVLGGPGAAGLSGGACRCGRAAPGLVLGGRPARLPLAAAGLALPAFISIPAGVVAAVRRGSLWDYVGTTGAVLGQAIPGFWLGLMLIYLFSVRLGWLPTGGTGGIVHFVMPCLVLASFYAARLARLTRSSGLAPRRAE